MRRLRVLLQHQRDLLLADRAVSTRRPCDVGLRDDAEAASTGVDDRDATHLELRHFSFYVAQIIVGGAGSDRRGHHVAEPGLRALAVADHADSEITVGYHANHA